MFNSILNTPLRSVTPCVPNTGKYGPEKSLYLDTFTQWTALQVPVASNNFYPSQL